MIAIGEGWRCAIALIEANVETTKSSAPDSPKSSALRVKNVLFATDFSATSEGALPYAVAICRRFGATLHAAHVLSDASLLLMTGGVDYVSMGTLYEDAHTDAREKIEQLALRLEGIPHRSYVRHGQVWKNLAEIIAANEIDLIVLGTHGRTGVGKLLLGSVAEDILRHAPCPVLTIGPKVLGHAKLPALRAGAQDLGAVDLDLKEIVFATDFAKSAVRAAKTAVALCAEFSAQLTMIHVIEDYAELAADTAPIEDSVRRLRELIPPGASLEHAPETLLEFGSATECILRIASQREADMIVLGARTAAEVGTTHLPWSTAHVLLAHAACPVLTVRA